MAENSVAEAISIYQRTGDSTLGSQLILHFEGLVFATCRTFYIDGQERDDLLQEGRIGLFKALRDFQPSCGASFTSFAVRCIRCQCISAIKAAHRCKHRILSQALSLDVAIYEDNERASWLDTLIDDKLRTPIQALITSEDYERCRLLFEHIFTPYDYDVFLSRLYGESYELIAQRVGRNVKSVDNALQRCRRAILRYVQGNDDLDATTMSHFFEIALKLHGTEESTVARAS